MSDEENIAVVDELGAVLEYQKRGDLKDQHAWKIICVWIENSKGQTLLQQRSFQKRLGPGLWTCAVEGTVEGDQSFEETARREIQEEIGLDSFTLVPAKKIFYKSNHGSRLAQGYTVHCDWELDQFTPQVEEVEQLAWRDKKEVIAEIKSGDPKYPFSAKVWLDMFDLV